MRRPHHEACWPLVGFAFLTVLCGVLAADVTWTGFDLGRPDLVVAGGVLGLLALHTLLALVVMYACWRRDAIQNPPRSQRALRPTEPAASPAARTATSLDARAAPDI